MPEDPPADQRQLLAATIQPIVAFMVLCSITIHGLSIPSFSLGRRVHTVTRTWSRHDTFGTSGGRNVPEWTTHTRHVRDGEEIVINRDREDAMERGVIPESESVTEKEPSDSSRERDDAEARRPDGTNMRDENLPDGEETEEEWREGAHRIVEKRAAPGEEVGFTVKIKGSDLLMFRNRWKWKCREITTAQSRPRQTPCVLRKIWRSMLLVRSSAALVTARKNSSRSSNMLNVVFKDVRGRSRSVHTMGCDTLCPFSRARETTKGMRVGCRMRAMAIPRARTRSALGSLTARSYPFAVTHRTAADPSAAQASTRPV